MEEVLRDAGFAVERERVLSSRDRIDFVVEGCVGVEVKVKDSRARVIRQLGRYAEHPALGALVLASAQRELVAGIPDEVHGVPVRVAVLKGRLM